MTKPLLFLFLMSSSIFAQDLAKNELELIEDTFQANAYLETNNGKGNKLIVFNEVKHKTALAKELFELGNNGVKVIENDYHKTYYKIVEKTEVPYYRVSYIYLDGEKLAASKISKLQRHIISEYKHGMPFKNLAQKYSMDSNANRGGDSGWFTNGEMHPDFEDDIIFGNHHIDDIYSLDIPSKQWHYIILQTHEPKNIAEIKVLKIEEPIE